MQEDIGKRILDSCLLSLMDNYEGPERNRWVTINCPLEEFEQTREFLASQVANGWLKKTFGDGYRLTAEGYRKYSPRAEALRTL